MTTLMTWAAKRTIMARIQAWSDVAAVGDPLYQVEIEYALPPNPERVCIYGGRARSTRTQATGEHAALFREDIVVDVRVRVQEVGGDIADTERTAEGIAQRVAAAVSAEPRIVSGLVAVTATDQDPTIVSPSPDSTVTVNVVLTVTLSLMTPGA